MKMKYNIKNIAAAALIGLGSTACSDWLDVDMEDKIMENVLFSEYRGFKSALNGIYTGMNTVYSSQLTTGGLDVMAQYYNVTENNSHTMRLYAGYKYTDAGFQTTIYTIWSNLYELIANTNVLLEHTEDDNEVLTEAQRGLIRGEAFALRAFLHFDLLRLYGPIYSENPSMVCIPYQSSSAREIQPLLPANEVLENIINDLKEAEKLLAQYDPILTNGVQNVATEDNGVSSYDLSFRQLRLNYYAVEALLARAYLWKGDKTEAYKYAKTNIIDKITTEELEVFPWATRAQLDDDGKPDYLFSSEVIFSLYNSRRVDNVYRAYFQSSLELSSRLTFIGNNTTGESKVAVFYDDPNDLRIRMWEVVEPSEAAIKDAADKGLVAENSLVLNKYKDFSDDAASSGGIQTYRYMIPLIRLSEIYFIAAEATTNNAEALELINTVRSHRECSNLPENTDFDRALTYEMAREVIGEGQLFYFYKRRNAAELISGTSITTTFEMTPSAYTLPIPDAEMEKRGTVSK